MEGATAPDPAQAFRAALTARMAAVAAELSRWASVGPCTLAEAEQRAMAAAQELGNALLAGVCGVLAAAPAAPERPCDCGQTARYLRQRSATVRTVLGPVAIERAYYYCAGCRHGHAPLDRQRGYCAGSARAGLDEALALLGATADSFEEAATLLGKLTLVRACPNLARAATERLGPAVQAAEAITYYTNNEHRMRYADYRARGRQLGSGSIESGGKQVITARLKQAGMGWSLDGARAVAAVRTRLKSGRWHEALALRPLRQRTYQRQAA